MAPPIMETPRSELADLARLSDGDDFADLPTQSSLPSPIKKGNTTALRSRTPLAVRRNVPSKNEFTPLLKSATKNRMAFSRTRGKENAMPETPAVLKAGYSFDSPGLPQNSSIVLDEQTGSSVGANDERPTPLPPVSSSSVMSTPVPSKQQDGPLDHGRNLATLREQEARLAQIDKENFSLKLKIHFMEEALRKNGKEFNEAAIKENTELKVDKITLQRDMKQYRKSLAQAEKNLDDYRKQLYEYADEVNRRHASEDMQEAMDKLHHEASDWEQQVKALERKLAAAETSHDHVAGLEDDIGDLEAELREKDRMLDEKDNEIEGLRQNSSMKEIEHQMQEQKEALQERELALCSVRDALSGERQQSKQKTAELEQAEDKIHDLETQLDKATRRSLEQANDKNEEIERHVQNILDLEARQKLLESQAHESQMLKNHVQALESSESFALREKMRAVEEKDGEIRRLKQRLASAAENDSDAKALQDKAQDLEDRVGVLEKSLRSKDAELTTWQKKYAEIEEEENVELLDAQERIHELELQQKQNLKEIEDFSKADRNESVHKELDSAQKSIKDLEKLRNSAENRAGQLEDALGELQEDVNSLQTRLETANRQHAAAQHSSTTYQKDLETRLIQAAEHEQIAKSELESLMSSNTVDVRLAKLQRVVEENEKNEDNFRQKIQDLEDDIEVVQSGAEEDAARNQDELNTSRVEIESLRRQYREVQHDLAKSQAENVDLRRIAEKEGKSEVPVTPSPQRKLHKIVLELERQVNSMKQEKSELQQKLNKAETASKDAQADYDGLRREMDLTSDWRSSAQERLQAFQSDVLRLKQEKQAWEDKQATMSAELASFKASTMNDSTLRAEMLKQSQELQSKLRLVQRETEVKYQSQISTYENDVQNLEQDLEGATSKLIDMTKLKANAERTVARLKTKVQRLEIDLAAGAAANGDRETSIEERADLHDMLKDAKLEAEDLVLQVRERDGRISSALMKEAELRAQLKRVRDERAAQSALAQALRKEIEPTHNKYDSFAKPAVPDSMSRQALIMATTGESSEAQQRRHFAELRGLAKQIEYLGARCRREAAFRADLSYMKEYFIKQVAMHARCTTADLKLVRAMGIQTQVVLAEEKRSQDRPRGFKTVALMVLAGVRIRRGAVAWRSVKADHEVLLRKLQGLRSVRAKSIESAKKAKQDVGKV